MVEGLSTLVQGSVKAVQGRFCTFPIKICLLMASLVAHWSQHHQTIPPEYSFCNYKWKDIVANQFCNTLAHCTAMQQMGHVWKT